MTKHKTKLVCVGWGIWDKKGYLWWNIVFPLRQDAIMYAKKMVEDDYKKARKARRVIAKRLWMEVNDE